MTNLKTVHRKNVKERLSYRASLRSLGAELEGRLGMAGLYRKIHEAKRVLNRYVDKDERFSPFMFSLCACVWPMKALQ